MQFMDKIRERLSPLTRMTLSKTSCFGSCVDLGNTNADIQLIHVMLLSVIHCDYEDGELWFLAGG